MYTKTVASVLYLRICTFIDECKNDYFLRTKVFTCRKKIYTFTLWLVHKKIFVVGHWKNYFINNVTLYNDESKYFFEQFWDGE